MFGSDLKCIIEVRVVWMCGGSVWPGMQCFRGHWHDGGVWFGGPFRGTLPWYTPAHTRNRLSATLTMQALRVRAVLWAGTLLFLVCLGERAFAVTDVGVTSGACVPACGSACGVSWYD